ncbi:hypothetical protein Cni_G22669 [Canna indica]|uniref:Uncharacterized protein n=1 Tax=Canna indica TaxID=4628 RepID=A0AAQ3QJS4_9LILI|nr:hypothetical protein Cni_G22669 [Canna indica]
MEIKPVTTYARDEYPNLMPRQCTGVPKLKSCSSAAAGRMTAKVVELNLAVLEAIIRWKTLAALKKEQFFTKPEMSVFQRTVSGSGIPSNTFSARETWAELR